MAEFQWKKESIASMYAKLTNLTELQKSRAASALTLWGGDMVAAIGEEIVKIGAVDQGQMIAATVPKPVALVGNRILKVTVINNTPQAFIAEFGREPNSKPPPRGSIVGWAVRHGIVSALPVTIPNGGEWDKKWAAAYSIMKRARGAVAGAIGKTSSKKKAKAVIDPVIRDLMIVIGIQQSIGRKGIKPRHPFTIAFERKRATFVQDITAMLK